MITDLNSLTRSSNSIDARVKRDVFLVARRGETRDVVYEIPPMKEFVGEHYMLLNPYSYQLEACRGFR